MLASESFSELVGQSRGLRQAVERVRQVVGSDVTVLIQGETGTGKELLARALHYDGPRREKPFVPVNCGAVPDPLLESELFGYERGAFTDAKTSKMGLMELADGGTFFFDEVCKLSENLQAKLLRVLETKEIRRLGGLDQRTVDVRIVGSTNADLTEYVKRGEFRQDLYYRLNVYPITVPPLRGRREDILPLAEHFLQSFRGRAGEGPGRFSQRAVEVMMTYDWPGNVRELRSAVHRAVINARGEEVGPQDLELVMPVNGDGRFPTFAEFKAKEYRVFLQRVLLATGGDVEKAAEILQVSRATVYRMINRYEVAY